VFRVSDSITDDLDHSIFTALLDGHDLTTDDKLCLALAWNRVDLAKTEIFESGQELTQSALENALMEALMNDRVDFARLLLEQGVSMQTFLTIDRLEDLYNTVIKNKSLIQH
jgi:hypothetical protein